MNIAGRIAKYFATSLDRENVVSAPRVMSSCLPISTMSISLVGLESRSTMLPASLAAAVPVFIATPTSACASAGASLVPSPVIATIRPPACSADVGHLVLGRRLGKIVVDPGFGRDAPRGQLRVAGDHHRADAHPAHLGEPLRDARLDHVLEVDDAEHPAGSATSSGVPPDGDPATAAMHSAGTVPPWSATQAVTADVAPLRMDTARPPGGPAGRRRSSGWWR